jgi:hypothetical protein
MGQNQANYFAEPKSATINQDMTRGDIVDALERLKFKDTPATLVVRMDGPVRDLLVSALRRKA